ncbi:MAG: glycoside hydrolase family 97 protein [Candidatus Limimorpha sp.]
MKSKSLIITLLLSAVSNIYAQGIYTVKSPDEKTLITINIDDSITYKVCRENTIIIDESPISMELEGGRTLGRGCTLRKSVRSSVDEYIEAYLYKKEEVRNNYNQIELYFKNNYKLTFRVFDDGVAYRFSTSFKNPIIVKKENVMYNFDGDHTVYMPFVNARNTDGDPIEKQFFTSFESRYTVKQLSMLEPGRLAFSPILVSLGDNRKAVIFESDLEEFPGTFYMKGEGNSLVSVQATYPKTEEQGGHNMLQLIVREREDYVAKVEGTRDFPWRGIAISDNDAELLDSDIVYKLASPTRVSDVSWIKSGKVAWDWWNDWNIKGVGFKAGVNNETYKYYIDFAASHNIEYVILDEGWAVNKAADLFQIIPEINLGELCAYANEKGVGLILWAGYYAMERDMENVCKHYSEMGIKGFKVDFMDRDDQKAVEFYYKMAETAAKYHLIVDFHGAYKPTGLCRTYPNVLNVEGVYGLENTKWDGSTEQVEYEVTIPFVRMVAGFLDYTQGAMHNASRNDFRAIYSSPMSQGTRCRQLAQYIIYESPLNMMCDSPSNYIENKECTDLIASIPTVWEKSVALDGKVGEYAVIARYANGRWYIGALTDWEERTIDIDLSRLSVNAATCTAFLDGMNANRNGEDYIKREIPIKGNSIEINMKKGGGALIIIESR